LGADGARSKVSRRALVVLAIVALCVYGVDQLAKYLVVTHLTPGKLVPVLGDLLQFQLVRNPGAAFSIGSGSTWIFSIIGVAVLIFVIWYAPRIRSTAWAVLFGLLLGGLLGNLTDRLFREPGFGEGHVVDFLRIPFLPAIFNLADTAIVTSMAMFLVLTIAGIGLDGTRHVEHVADQADAGLVSGTSDADAGDVPAVDGSTVPGGSVAEDTPTERRNAGGADAAGAADAAGGADAAGAADDGGATGSAGTDRSSAEPGDQRHGGFPRSRSDAA
jgi:signal peptidase II